MWSNWTFFINIHWPNWAKKDRILKIDNYLKTQKALSIWNFIPIFKTFYWWKTLDQTDCCEGQSVGVGHSLFSTHSSLSSRLMNNGLQKHPSTHCLVQNGVGLQHVGWQYVPHLLKISFDLQELGTWFVALVVGLSVDTEVVALGHFESRIHFVELLLSSTYPFLQKHPPTHLFMHRKFLISLQ